MLLIEGVPYAEQPGNDPPALGLSSGVSCHPPCPEVVLVYTGTSQEPVGDRLGHPYRGPGHHLVPESHLEVDS